MFFPSMMGKKSVGGTLLFPSYYDGKKECGVHFQMSTVLKGKKSVVHSFSPSVRWGKRAGVHFFSLDNIALAMVGTQIVKIR